MYYTNVIQSAAINKNVANAYMIIANIVLIIPA